MYDTNDSPNDYVFQLLLFIVYYCKNEIFQELFTLKTLNIIKNSFHFENILDILAL
jgi:hypothetical protein